jgi:hypothetical protein
MKTEALLQLLVNDTSLIKYHQDWGFYIETPFEAIRMIGLIEVKDGLELCLYYGDSQSQSRAFYRQNIKLDVVNTNEWEIRPNFHFSSTFRNLIWFRSDLKNEDYISFWKRNLNLLHQHPIKEVPKLVEYLSKEKVITINKNELQAEIYNKDYTRLNICAGFAVTYKISFLKRDELINNGQIKNFLIDRINEGLKLIGENGSRFLIDLNIDYKSDFEEGIEDGGYCEMGDPSGSPDESPSGEPDGL